MNSNDDNEPTTMDKTEQDYEEQGHGRLEDAPTMSSLDDTMAPAASPVASHEEVIEKPITCQKHVPRRVKQLTSQTCGTTDEDDFFGPPLDEDNEAVAEEENGSVLSDLTNHCHQQAQESCKPEPKSRYYCPCLSWSKRRERWTALGCLSSVVVLIVRLLLDRKPTAYVIHSWVVFVDMVLIHCFTNSLWLSVGGECVTILFFLSFHFTKETVFELAETTLIAVLCSFHMIRSRSKVLNKMEHLEEIVEEMSSRQEEVLSIRMHGGGIQVGEDEMEDSHSSGSSSKDIARILQEMEQGLSNNLRQRRREDLQRNSKKCCQHFFEHFLDGSAGVMYTSFAGLIISEMLNYGRSSY